MAAKEIDLASSQLKQEAFITEALRLQQLRWEMELCCMHVREGQPRACMQLRERSGQPCAGIRSGGRLLRLVAARPLCLRACAIVLHAPHRRHLAPSKAGPAQAA